MKVGILAGGLGTRMAPETEVRPKPMVEVGGQPMLWHIMKLYAHHGYTEFAVALGHLGETVKRYFADRVALSGDLRVDLANGVVDRRGPRPDAWTVDLVDTGIDTNTGGRIKQLAPFMGDDTFFLTWGDGVADIDIDALLHFHRSHGRLVTVTAVRPPARFGRLDIEGEQVVRFAEKPQLEEGWINGAFFVCEPAVFEYIDGHETQFEREPMERLAKDGELMAFRHHGFWQCMDTLRDRKLLEKLWSSGGPPWKVWDD